MGLFDFFRRKKSIERIIESDFVNNGAEPRFDLLDKTKRDKIVLDKCEYMMDLSKQKDEARKEYDMVTASLVDVQQIDGIPGEQRAGITAIASKIDELLIQRKEYQNVSERITDPRFSKIRMYENELPKAVETLKESENYQAMVKKDIHSLEGEKGELLYQVECIEDELEGLKKYGIAVPIILVVAFAITFFIQPYVVIDLSIVYFVLLFLAALAGVYIFVKVQNDMKEIKQANVNINYAITLLNKTKIRYVNETNAIEYRYNKFGVNSAYELNFLWNEYSKAKEEREKLRGSTDELEYYSNMLSNKLANYNVKDTSIWINQVKALTDSREMVEIRHGLNERRQKLRNRIEYCSMELENVKKEIMDLVKKYPQYANEVLDIVASIDSIEGI